MSKAEIGVVRFVKQLVDYTKLKQYKGKIVNLVSLNFGWGMIGFNILRVKEIG